MLLTQMIFQVADTGAEGGTSSLIMNMLPLLAIFVIFYFLLIRPQQQRQKKHREMLAALAKGDDVVTSGGIVGRVTKITDEEVTIDTLEGGKLRLVRGMIMDKRNPATPAAANDTKES